MIGDEVQKAIHAALIAADVCSGRIYDQVPSDRVYPYITIGDELVSDDSNSCGDAWSVYPDIHAWSRPKSGSKSEVKKLIAQIVEVLNTELALDGFEIVLVEFESARTLRERDGITEHSIITLRYDVQPDA